MPEITQQLGETEFKSRNIELLATHSAVYALQEEQECHQEAEAVWLGEERK